MADDAVELVRLRNHFYRNNYRLVVVALLVCLMAILVLTGVVFYNVTHKPTPHYFATTADGRIIPIIALNRPNQSDATVVKWAAQTAVQAYSFNFTNYRDILQALSENFTSDGWHNYMGSLKKSRNLVAIKSEKLSMYAVSTGPAVIVGKGTLGGVYTWSVQMPMLVTLVSASKNIPQSLNISMTINRVSTLDNPKGIQIEQFVASPRSSTGG